MLATSRIVCDSHLERAVSNFSFLLLAPISSRSAEIGIMTKLEIRRFIDLNKTTITVSLQPAPNGHFVSNKSLFEIGLLFVCLL